MEGYFIAGIFVGIFTGAILAGLGDLIAARHMKKRGRKYDVFRDLK